MVPTLILSFTFSTTQNLPFLPMLTQMPPSERFFSGQCGNLILLFWHSSRSPLHSSRGLSRKQAPTLLSLIGVGAASEGAAVRFNSVPSYIWYPILIISVFNGEPLPNALLYGREQSTIFKSSKHRSLYHELRPGTILPSLPFLTLQPHNSPGRWALPISPFYR